MIILATVIVYGQTLDVPFYLDDYSSILENPPINDQGSLGKLWSFAPLRVVGYATFLLNFQLNHAQPTWYHIVNILIHILAGLSLFVLIRALLKTPAVKGKTSSRIRIWLPLCAALLFVIHPMQTQAVTYVVQRLASLVALWYMASLVCYIYARLSLDGSRRIILFTASFIFALLAFFTKQNSFTLPLLLVTAELIFFPASRGRTLRNLVIASGIGLLLWGVLVFVAGFDSLSLAALDAKTRETKAITRPEYFLTQLQVLWTYIRMFFIPVGLHLEHDVSLVRSLNGSTVFALLAHLAVLVGGLFVCRRSPLLAFGIFFFYISSLVESALIPIRDLMFEHRSYLPNAGLCVFTSCLLLALPFKQKIGNVLIVSILLLSAVFTWQRNNVWRDPAALWYDSAIHAPYLARPWNEYAKHLIERGEYREAIAVFQQTMKRIPGDGRTPGSYLEETAAVNFMMVLAREGETELSLQVADDFLQRKIRPLNKSKMLANKGNLYFQTGQLVKAEASYKQAIAAYPKNIPPMNNLGTLYMRQGRLDEAEELFRRALTIDPSFQAGRKQLQKIALMKKKRDQAR